MSWSHLCVSLHVAILLNPKKHDYETFTLVSVPADNIHLENAVSATQGLFLRDLPAHVCVGPMPPGALLATDLPLNDLNVSSPNIKHLSPTPAAMAPKLAQPMAAAKPKMVVECDDESSCEDFVFEDDFWECLGELNHMFTFTLIALAWLLSVCCMSQQLERSLFMCRSDWILPPPDHPVWWERRPERSRSPPPRPAPRTPPGPPPPTPPGETGLMMPMTPPELLGPAPGTPDSVWSLM